MRDFDAIRAGEIEQAKSIIRLAKQIIGERSSATARRALARGIVECAQVIAEFDPTLPPPMPRGGPGQPMHERTA